MAMDCVLHTTNLHLIHLVSSVQPICVPSELPQLSSRIILTSIGLTPVLAKVESLKHRFIPILCSSPPFNIILSKLLSNVYPSEDDAQQLHYSSMQSGIHLVVDQETCNMNCVHNCLVDLHSIETKGLTEFHGHVSHLNEKFIERF